MTTPKVRESLADVVSGESPEEIKQPIGSTCNTRAETRSSSNSPKAPRTVKRREIEGHRYYGVKFQASQPDGRQWQAVVEDMSLGLFATAYEAAMRVDKDLDRRKIDSRYRNATADPSTIRFMRLKGTQLLVKKTYSTDLRAIVERKVNISKTSAPSRKSASRKRKRGRGVSQSSKYYGVSYMKDRRSPGLKKVWRAFLAGHYLGSFNSETEAAARVDRFLDEYRVDKKYRNLTADELTLKSMKTRTFLDSITDPACKSAFAKALKLPLEKKAKSRGKSRGGGSGAKLSPTPSPKRSGLDENGMKIENRSSKRRRFMSKPSPSVEELRPIDEPRTPKGSPQLFLTPEVLPEKKAASSERSSSPPRPRTQLLPREAGKSRLVFLPEIQRAHSGSSTASLSSFADPTELQRIEHLRRPHDLKPTTDNIEAIIYCAHCKKVLRASVIKSNPQLVQHLCNGMKITRKIGESACDQKNHHGPCTRFANPEELYQVAESPSNSLPLVPPRSGPSLKFGLSLGACPPESRNVMPKLELPPASASFKELPPRVKIEDPHQPKTFAQHSDAFRLSPVKLESRTSTSQKNSPSPFFFANTPLQMPTPSLSPTSLSPPGRPASPASTSARSDEMSPNFIGRPHCFGQHQLALNKDTNPEHSVQASRVVANFFRAGILSTAQKVLACGVLNNEFGFVNKAAMVYFCLTLDTNNVKLLVSKCLQTPNPL